MTSLRDLADDIKARERAGMRRVCAQISGLCDRGDGGAVYCVKYRRSRVGEQLVQFRSYGIWG